MRKLTILFTLLTLSVGLWAAETQMVSYLYPVYNTDGNPASGIKEWKEGTAMAIVITSSNEKVTWQGDWYVVQGYGIELTKGVECYRNINLILADDALLRIPTTESLPGIKVSGDNASLTIYGQTKNNGTLRVSGGPESAGIGSGKERGATNITINGGKIFAQGGGVSSMYDMGGAGIGGGNHMGGSNIIINNGEIQATGGNRAAGIGGGFNGSGSNIIINGGKITAIGSDGAAGIGGGYYGSGSDITINGGKVTATGGDLAAGIGGGERGSGSNIAINGGEVIANGGFQAVGIGGGRDGSGSNITVATQLVVKAGEDDKPSTQIAPLRTDTTDIASDLAGKQYVTIETDLLLNEKNAALDAINAALEGIDNDNITAIATSNYIDIKTATTTSEIDFYKTRAIANINAAIAAYNNGLAAGDAAGYQRAKDELPTDPEGSKGTAVVVAKDNKSVTLINPDKVTYIKVE